MRMMIWVVGLLALATSLDSSLYGGRYTRGTVQMFLPWLAASDSTRQTGLPLARNAMIAQPFASTFNV